MLPITFLFDPPSLCSLTVLNSSLISAILFSTIVKCFLFHEQKQNGRIFEKLQSSTNYCTINGPLFYIRRSLFQIFFCEFLVIVILYYVHIEIYAILLL